LFQNLQPRHPAHNSGYKKAGAVSLSIISSIILITIKDNYLEKKEIRMSSDSLLQFERRIESNIYKRLEREHLKNNLRNSIDTLANAGQTPKTK